MGVALRLGVAILGDVDLAADDRLDACSGRMLEELDGPCHRAVIGEADRRHIELGRPRNQVGDPARAVENRVLGVDVQVDERGLRHARATLRHGQDCTRNAGFRELARSGRIVQQPVCRR